MSSQGDIPLGEQTVEQGRGGFDGYTLELATRGIYCHEAASETNQEIISSTGSHGMDAVARFKARRTIGEMREACPILELSDYGLSVRVGGELGFSKR